MSDREERIARNETTFRRANEKLRAEFGAMAYEHGDEHVPFICECGDRTCTQVMLMALGEYEAVRASADTFAVVPDHSDEPTEELVEDVVERNDRYAIVRKRAEHRAIVEATDPRR
jgi:hypothetical protein